MDWAFDALSNTTDPSHPSPAPDLVSTVSSSTPLSENGIAVASPLGHELFESRSTPSAYGKSTALAFNAAHEGSTLALDGLSSADGVRSASEHRQSACSPMERPTTWSPAKHPTLHLTANKLMPSMMNCWERAATGGEVGGQLPTIKEAGITLDQAIVWPPSTSSAHVGEATGAADEVQVYGGGQIIGLNGDVILSADSLGE